MCQGGGEGGAGGWGEKRAADQHWVVVVVGSSCFNCRIALIRTGLELLRDKRLV